MNEYTITEYLGLKRKLRELEKSLDIIPKDNKDLTDSCQKKIDNISKQINLIEKTSIIVDYKKLLSQKTNLIQRISGFRRYKKDTSVLEHQLQELLDKIDNLDKQTVKPREQIINTAQINYYIINLAWSNVDERILNILKEYLNRSTYINFEPCEHMMRWKFSYDSLEERSHVKSLLMASSHMLDVLKDLYSKESDIEIFGKLIKI